MSELSQNFRNRVLDVVALVADEAAQRKYQATVPNVDVPAELFIQWEESFFSSDEDFRSAFDDEELAALHSFDLVVEDVSASTPQQLPPLNTFVNTVARRRLSYGARTTLGVPTHTAR